MRLLLSIFTVMLIVQSANAQALWRNYWTTNQYPQNALSLTNLQATNIAGTIPPSNLSTNTPSAGQVLTATSASTAAWKNFGAQYTGFWNYGTNIVISPTNGNLQNWTLTNVSYAAMDYDTNYTETIRLNIYNSNTVTWTTTYLSNSANLGPSNRISVILFDHPQDTNLWWGYRLR